MVQAAPGASFVVIQPQLFLELLVRLLARPACLDGGSELFEAGFWRVAGEVEFAFACGAVLAHEPAFLAG